MNVNDSFEVIFTISPRITTSFPKWFSIGSDISCAVDNSAMINNINVSANIYINANFVNVRSFIKIYYICRF